METEFRDSPRNQKIPENNKLAHSETVFSEGCKIDHGGTFPWNQISNPSAACITGTELEPNSPHRPSFRVICESFANKCVHVTQTAGAYGLLSQYMQSEF